MSGSSIGKNPAVSRRAFLGGEAALPANAPLSFTVSPLNAYGGKGDSIRILLSPSELARLRKV
jgi:hypothetical protein